MAAICPFFPSFALGQDATVIYNGHGYVSSYISKSITGSSAYWGDLKNGLLRQSTILVADMFDGSLEGCRCRVHVRLYEPSQECKSWLCVISDGERLSLDKFKKLQDRRVLYSESGGCWVVAHTIKKADPVYLEV